MQMIVALCEGPIEKVDRIISNGEFQAGGAKTKTTKTYSASFVKLWIDHAQNILAAAYNPRDNRCYLNFPSPWGYTYTNSSGANVKISDSLPPATRFDFPSSGVRQSYNGSIIVSGSSRSIVGFAIARNFKDKYYAASSSGIIYESDNRGTTWKVFFGD